jgi:phosphopantetheinyl transferase
MLAVHDVELDLGFLFERRPARPIDWRHPARRADDGRKMPLATAWPMLRLQSEALERLRQPVAAGNTGNGSVNGSPAMPEPGVSTNGSPPERAATVELPVAPEPDQTPASEAPIRSAADRTPSSPTTTRSSSLTVLAAPAAADGELGADAALDGYLETMRRFLTATEDVMSAYLGEGALDAAAASVVERAPFPLVGTITSCEPEVELVARRVFDPAEDRYLLDHTLGRTISHTDPGLHGLALMPLAMSIEILAEAASCLLPGRVVTGLRDVLARRWLAFREAPQTLQVSARRLPGEGGCERVLAELRNLDDAHAAPEPVVAATVLLGERFQPAPPAAERSLRDGRPSPWPPEQLYTAAMFHGPLWQGVRGVDVLAPAGARARLEVLPRAGMLRDAPEPDFVLDPVILDAAGQVIGFWAAEMLEQARVVFPFRLASLDVYGPAPPRGETLTCDAAITLEADQLVSSDIEVHDATGRCWLRLEAWEDKRFAIPEQLAPLLRPAELPPLSVPWQAPLAHYPDRRMACRRLDARLPADRALWIPAWAGRVLTRRERELFAESALPEARQLEWLAARTAAKEGVAELIHAAHGLELLPAEIEILPDASGAPVVLVPGLEDAAELPVVSLTHAHGRAAALVALVPRGLESRVGIDLERLVPRPHGFAEAAFTDSERRLLDPLPEDAVDEWLLRMWCAREAAGKAQGSGLGGGSEAARVSAIEPPRQAVSVDVAGRRLPVWTQRDGDLIVATAVLHDRSFAEGGVEAAR